ncbi:MAG: glycogen-binding domain-containing protein [Tepidisphaeraceae bacterium]
MTSILKDGQIEFRFFRPGAVEVKIAGDFCGWRGDRALEMQPECDGWWSAHATLEPGEYRFRYLADGRWFTDFAAHGVEYARHCWNSVLIVPEN